MKRLKILELVLYVAYVASLIWFMSRDDIKDKYKLGLRWILVLAACYLFVWLYNDWVLIIN